MKDTEAQLTLEFKRRSSERQTFYSQIGIYCKKRYQNIKVLVIKRDKAPEVETSKKGKFYCTTSRLSQDAFILEKLQY